MEDDFNGYDEMGCQKKQIPPDVERPKESEDYLWDSSTHKLYFSLLKPL